jgi:hypothetical protein
MTQLRRSRRRESTPEVFAARGLESKQTNSRVSDAPFEEPKSVPARFAPKGINVKKAHQTFRTDPTDSFNVIAGALGTNRLRPLNVSLASQALLLDLKLFYRFLACLQLMVQFTDFGLEFRIVLGNLPGLRDGFTRSAFGRP